MTLPSVLAVIDWPSFALVGGVFVTALTTILTYRRGSKTDDQLNLSTMTQANFTAQAGLVDQLQEENGRLRTALSTADETEARLRKDVADARHEAAADRAAVHAGELLVAAKDAAIAERDRTIAAHAARIAELETPHG